MTTIIEPGNRLLWDNVITVKHEEDWKIVNDALFIVAAHMTRGGRKANKALFARIMYNMSELYDPEYVGKFAYYLRLVFEAKPISYQTHTFISREPSNAPKEIEAV